MYENPSRGSRAVPCGRTDRHEADNFFFFLQFCNFANAANNKAVFYMLDWKSEQQESKLHAVNSDSNFLFLFFYQQEWIYYLFNFQSHSYDV